MSERSREARDELVTAHLWLAEAIARELAWLAPRTADGDVLQPAREGLVKAADHFDPGRGGFVPYARRWIRGEIFRAVDATVPGFARRYGVAASLFDALGEEGSDEGAGEALDHAALVMCLGSESLRRARVAPSGMGRALSEALACLPEEGRSVFLGRAMDGLTWEELAEQAGASVSTVKRRMREALEAVRQSLRAVQPP